MRPLAAAPVVSFVAIVACASATSGTGSDDAGADAGPPRIELAIEVECPVKGETRTVTSVPGKEPACTVRRSGTSYAVSAAVVKGVDNFWQSEGWPEAGKTLEVAGGLTITGAECPFSATKCVLSAEAGMGAAPGRASSNVACEDGSGRKAAGFIKVEGCDR
ncbi:MAG: hypothetical protein U0174_05335 [Polyangiaceae bacterium]